MLAQLDCSEDAIFLIIRNDHVPIIRQMFQENPFFQTTNPNLARRIKALSLNIIRGL